MNVSIHPHAPAALPPQKDMFQYSLYGRLGKFESRSEPCIEEKNFPLPRIEHESVGRQARSLIILCSELFQLELLTRNFQLTSNFQ
jgi:hypothetical protein